MSIDKTNKDRVAIGVRIRLVVDAAGTTRRAAAEAIGVAPSFLSEVVAGKSYPSVPMLVGLRRVYGVTIDWFLLGKEPAEGTHTHAAVPTTPQALAPEIEELVTLLERAKQSGQLPLIQRVLFAMIPEERAKMRA